MPARRLGNPLLIVLLTLATFALTACGGAGSTGSSSGEDRPFPELKKEARGTEVNLAMYGGDEAINTYVDDYVIPELEEKHDIELTRTPLGDTADAVNKLLNEKQAGEDTGTIDLVWINGENFATGAGADLWFGPWAEELPNAKFINWESPSINRDFGYPVEGREAPWGKSQFVMIHDSARVKDPPKTMDEIRTWTEKNPGRFAYPAPPDFTGNAFVEQALYDVTGQVDAYQKPF
ncbi:MAG: ABC transporter substrate-binding protein, partial [Rubrobacter sp.]|nr:ABC transporter substrate-binding protein [Rubrobacter sp.]